MEYGIIAQLSLQYKLLLQTINDHTLTRVHFTYKPKHNWNRQLKTPSIQIPYKTITYIFTDGHGQNTQHPWLQPAPLWAWLESAFSTIKQRPIHFLEQWLNGLRQGLYPKGTSIWPLLIDKNIYTSKYGPILLNRLDPMLLSQKKGPVAKWTVLHSSPKDHQAPNRYTWYNPKTGNQIQIPNPIKWKKRKKKQ